jgi:amino-acid N-acetyltransferase
MLTLPSGCHLRPASAKDIWAIRQLVLSAKLDPTQLRWQQFSVVECNERVVACGQLRAFAGAQELGSLVVVSNWRGKGLGTYLVEYLIGQATQPLYLECLGQRLTRFYTRFGFVPVAWEELPRSLKFKFALSALGAKLGVPVIIMRYARF